MRLPHRNDPGGNAEGACRRERVLEVLYVNQVTVRHEEGMTYLEQDEIVFAMDLPDMVSGQAVKFIARRFGINITEFHDYGSRNIH